MPLMLTAGMDPLAAMLPLAASSSRPASEPCDGKGCVLQLRNVSELSTLPYRSAGLGRDSTNLKMLEIHINNSSFKRRQV